MSDEKHEKIADIVKEMRSNEFDDPSFNVYSLVAARTLARGWADRIEEAVNQPVTNCNHPGNAAKMRDALGKIASMGAQTDCQLGSSDETVYAFLDERCIAHNISECARSALSATPRNCDVGTADEQEDRFERFCDTHKYVGDDGANICSQDCPCYNNLDCGVRWSQMPYEEVKK